MENLFQQNIITKVIGLKKSRIEYLMMKANIKPAVLSPGTGIANQFDFSGILTFDIVDCLSMWGFAFPKIRAILDEIKKKQIYVFEIEDIERDGFVPPIDEHITLAVKGIPAKRRECDHQSYLSNVYIGKIKDIFSKKMKDDIFQAPYGFFSIDLTIRKIQVLTGLIMSGGP